MNGQQEKEKKNVPPTLAGKASNRSVFQWHTQGSADSNYSQPSSDLSLDDEREALRRETERLALAQLDKARVQRVQSATTILEFKNLKIEKKKTIMHDFFAALQFADCGIFKSECY